MRWINEQDKWCCGLLWLGLALGQTQWLLAFEDLASSVTPPPPLTPAQSMATMQIAEELRVDLVASEPLAQDPVAICWDAYGAMYVAEMGDYPQEASGGKIRRLSDSNGDGVMDQASIFVPRVAYPSSVLPYRDGILVAAAPDILWFRDSDRDGVADQQQVLITGFVEGNQQLRVNGLVWGLDQWVYGANGRSSGNIQFTSDGNQPITDPVSISNRDFRFHPDQRKIETTGGFTQFGQSFDDFGNRFISWNTIHIRHVVMEQRYLNRNPNAPITATSAEISLEGSTPRIYPISQTTQRFNAEPPGYFNASCGLSIYRGDLLPESYRGNAFACEPLSNLVHRDRLEANGTTFVAKRPAEEHQREFLSAKDPWFRPVNTTTGPDGALYIVDFYRPWVEHPQFVADAGARAAVDFSAGQQFGRIYRITSKATSDRKPPPTNVADLDDESLIDLLGSSNAWQRETAQRLLVERQTDRWESVKSKATASSVELQRLHAYAVMYGLRQHFPEWNQLVGRMLLDSSATIRRMGLRWSEEFLEVEPDQVDAWAGRIAPLLDDNDYHVRLQAIATFSYLRFPAKPQRLARAFQHSSNDPWMRQAIFAAIGSQTVEFLDSLSGLSSIDPSDLEPDQVLWLLQVVASEAAAHQARWEDLYQKVARTIQAGEQKPFWQLLISLGLARKLETAWVEDFAARNQEFSEQLKELSELAQFAQPMHSRVLAVGMIQYVDRSDLTEALRNSLAIDQPLEIQQWAAKAAAGIASPERAELLIDAVTKVGPVARRTLLDTMIGRQQWAVKLAQAIVAGQVDAALLEGLQRQLLLGRLPAELRDQAERVWLAPTASSKTQSLVDYLQAYTSSSDAQAGKLIYQQHCQSCHAIGPSGHRVGPDLTSVAGRSPEDIIIDILDPNRSVAADGYALAILTHDGEVITGVIAGETTSSVSLKKAGGELVSVLRGEIQELQHLRKSLMPEGFETALTPQQVSQLVAYLKSPL